MHVNIIISARQLIILHTRLLALPIKLNALRLILFFYYSIGANNSVTHWLLCLPYARQPQNYNIALQLSILIEGIAVFIV